MLIWYRDGVSECSQSARVLRYAPCRRSRVEPPAQLNPEPSLLRMDESMHKRMQNSRPCARVPQILGCRELGSQTHCDKATASQLNYIPLLRFRTAAGSCSSQPTLTRLWQPRITSELSGAGDPDPGLLPGAV